MTVRAFREAVGDIVVHGLRSGSGVPVFLLHGWPEFSAVWRPVMERLSGSGLALLAPDLRGFGDTRLPHAPREPAGTDRHAADILLLADMLGFDRFGLVAHDLSAYPAMAIARRHAKRVTGLFLFDTPYPGIGARWTDPHHVANVWHLWFHLQPWAAGMVGASRESCKAYIGHFLNAWTYRKDAFDAVLDDWVDNFMKPGNLQGGFDWYVANHAARQRAMTGQAAPLERIRVPTCVRWGANDPALPIAWADRLGEFFERLDFAPFPEAGHFPHFEQPDGAASEIGAFFGEIRRR